MKSANDYWIEWQTHSNKSQVRRKHSIDFQWKFFTSLPNQRSFGSYRPILSFCVHPFVLLFTTLTTLWFTIWIEFHGLTNSQILGCIFQQSISDSKSMIFQSIPFCKQKLRRKIESIDWWDILIVEWAYEWVNKIIVLAFLAKRQAKSFIQIQALLMLWSLYWYNKRLILIYFGQTSIRVLGINVVEKISKNTTRIMKSAIIN